MLQIDLLAQRLVKEISVATGIFKPIHILSGFAGFMPQYARSLKILKHRVDLAALLNMPSRILSRADSLSHVKLRIMLLGIVIAESPCAGLLSRYADDNAAVHR
ncbi:hypothetical protein IHE31_00625 (plasmid) [Mycetohabitans rhizoxinica]